MSSKKTCPTCKQSICHASYSRHRKSHTIYLCCDRCPLLQFNRRDNYMRHMRLHGSPVPTICSSHESDIIHAPQSQLHHLKAPNQLFTTNEMQIKSNLATFTVDAPIISNVETAEFV